MSLLLHDVDLSSPSTPQEHTPCRIHQRHSDCGQTLAHTCGSAKTNASKPPSHNIKPGRRRFGLQRYTTAPPAWLLTLLVLVVLCGISEAGIDLRGSREIQTDLEFAELARKGEILMDRRPVPRVGQRDLLLWPRQGGGDLFGSSTATPASTSGAVSPSINPSSSHGSSSSSHSSSPSSTTASASTSTSASSVTTAPSAATTSALPKPFDTSLGSNFTSSACPTFFNSFLNNVTFISCLPFSLLLQNSNSFFLAEKSVTLITQTLDATCKVNFATCSALMSNLAVQIRDDANCGMDYADQNALVTQAYNGLVAYAPLYQAGCLKDSSGNYCFANAITNVTSPSDSYPYYLPLGVALPGASRPTCSSCLQQTMNIFAGAATNLSQPVSGQYVSAAVQIDQGCGPTFINSSITPIQGTQPVTNTARGPLRAMMGATVVLGAVIGALMV